jgi:hypothetical protein
MQPRTTRETAIICVAAVLVVTVVIIPVEIVPYGQSANTRGILWLAAAAVAALGMVLGYRYLTTRKRAHLELTGSEQYRQLAEECPVMAVPPPALARELRHGRLARAFWRRSLTPERVLRDQRKPAA